MRKQKGGFDTFTLDDYLITEEGEVINIRWGGRKVKPQPNGKGYMRVHIAGKMHFVHRLVAEKYVPNPDNLPQINHKDGDKTNNRADNLEWVSNLENRQHAVKEGLHIHGERCPWAKLKQSDVDYIRQHTEMTSREIAQMFGVSDSLIRTIRRREAWKD
jgi:DNA-binding transcriptional regulator YiaG